MTVVKYGSVEVSQPVFDGELCAVETLGDGGALTDFRYGERSLRHLDIVKQRLARGWICDVEIQRADLDEVTLDSVRFEACTLLSGQWRRSRLSRAEFHGCRILGMTFAEHKWTDVVFSDCLIEYVTFDDVRTAGPVVFSNCRFREVSLGACRFAEGCMQGCELRDVEVSGGSFRGFDLRGSDLSTLRGAANLRGSTISLPQRAQIAEALVGEIDFCYAEDPDHG